MNEVRDNVKLALPFAAGTASFSCLSISLQYTYMTATISLILSVLFLFHILQELRLEKRIEVWKIPVMCFITGIFISSNSNLVDITSGEWLINHTKEFGEQMQSWIDGIHFSSESTNAVIKALLTGNRNGIPAEITKAFRDSGASHILALSGLHLGIIYMIVSKLTAIIGNSPNGRITRSLVCIALCAAYSFATGASASIIRALLFIVIREISTLIHRATDLKTTITTCLVIHIILAPSDITSVGFQLSYAAIAGIAWFHPWLSGSWEDDAEKKGIMKRIWDSASLSISCQLTTSPIAWLYFNTFPQYFILTNLIALPLTAIIIPIAILTTTLHAMGICPDLLIYCTEIMVNALCSTLTIISNM
jgi:ComEC/Rec2-related protein